MNAIELIETIRVLEIRRAKLVKERSDYSEESIRIGNLLQEAKRDAARNRRWEDGAWFEEQNLKLAQAREDRTNCESELAEVNAELKAANMRWDVMRRGCESRGRPVEVICLESGASLNGYLLKLFDTKDMIVEAESGDWQRVIVTKCRIRFTDVEQSK